MKVTNISKAPQGINAKSGRVFIHPGESKDVEFDEAGLKLVRRLKGLLTVEGDGAAATSQIGTTRTASEVLALADGNFMAFKSAASKLLGEKTPSSKAEIVAALEELATKPE